ncbi:MAG: cyclopropane-fatty-acyl-phospholipid synthase family protein [Acidobacteriota bacterium]
MATAMSPFLRLLEADRLPDPLIRFAIRRLLAGRLRELRRGGPAAQQARFEAFVEELRSSPIALSVDDANRQHYEVPTAFFQWVLGQQLKYSSCLWPAGVDRLAEAEQAMLEATVERAELADGQEILELGCGWGSLSLFMADRFPRARVLAVSNSASQKEFIDGEAQARGLGNLTVQTADMNEFDPHALAPDRTFDRVVSVEMFEHMRNYAELFARIGRWTRADAKVFVHVFCHRHFAYPFIDSGRPGDWMARHFFTGGLMPSADLLPRFDATWRLEQRWLMDGTHYQKTSEAWLARMDLRRNFILPLLEEIYGPGEGTRWWVRWRVFFMACAELFGYGGGEEWLVAHYRFVRASETET